MRILFIVIRIVGAVAIVAAIVAQLVRSLQNWDAAGVQDLGVQITNFFSFFTIESNILAFVVFVVGAVMLVRDRPEGPRWAVYRGSVAAYMATTGIVYNLLLRGVELPQGTTVLWSNEVLHVVAPLLIIADWLFAPGRRRLEWKHIGIVVIFPLVWAIYTMIRGPIVQDEVSHKPYWYPYPFLNPNIAPEGYFSVAFYVVLIAAIIGGVGALVILVSRKGERWPLRQSALRG